MRTLGQILGTLFIVSFFLVFAGLCLSATLVSQMINTLKSNSRV